MKKHLKILITSCLFISGTLLAEDNLASAIKSADVDRVSKLIQQSTYSAQQQANYLIQATAVKSVDVLAAMLENGFTPDAIDGPSHSSAFMYAAYRNRIDMMQVLFQHGVDINRPDKIGDPAINWATYGGQYEAVKWLINHNARLDLTGHGKAIEIAKRRGFVEIIDLLCQTQSCNNQVSSQANELTIAIKANNFKQAERLLSKISSSSLDYTGRPLFHHMARLGSLALLKKATAQNVDINQQDDIGFTALHEAARNGHLSVVSHLLEFGANVNHISKANSLNLSPLHLAAIEGHQAVISYLVRHKADINAIDRDGNTPLHWAIYHQQKNVTKQLLALGADKSLTNEQNISAQQLLAD